MAMHYTHIICVWSCFLSGIMAYPMTKKHDSVQSLLLAPIDRQIDMYLQDKIRQHIKHIQQTYTTQKIIASQEDTDQLFSLIKQMRRDCVHMLYHIQDLKDLAKTVKIYIEKPQILRQLSIHITTLKSLHNRLRKNRLYLEKASHVLVPHARIPSQTYDNTLRKSHSMSVSLSSIYRQLDTYLKNAISQHFKRIKKKYSTKEVVFVAQHSPTRAFSLIKQMRHNCVQAIYYIHALEDLAKKIKIYLDQPQPTGQYSIKTLESHYSILKENRLYLEREFGVPVPYTDSP